MRSDCMVYARGYGFIAGAGFAGIKIPRWRSRIFNVSVCMKFSRLCCSTTNVNTWQNVYANLYEYLVESPTVNNEFGRKLKCERVSDKRSLNLPYN